jgi:mono/diheme cytochrome c family protein
MRRPLIALLPLALVACAQTPVLVPAAVTETPSTALQADRIDRGRAIVSRECAACHGADRGETEWPDAPPLQNLLADFDTGTLNEEFRQSLTVGHPGMPQYLYGPKTADLLLAYLVSIQEPAPEAPASED